MKKLVLLCICIIFSSCIPAPHYKSNNVVYDRQKADDQERDFNLQVKAVKLSEKSQDKEVEIEYEIKNNSKINVFDQKLKNYKLFYFKNERRQRNC